MRSTVGYTWDVTLILIFALIIVALGLDEGPETAQNSSEKSLGGNVGGQSCPPTRKKSGGGDSALEPTCLVFPGLGENSGDRI